MSEALSKPPVFRGICFVLCGLVGLQMLQNSHLISFDRIPGEIRGDIKLAEESLPRNLAGWERSKFTPPKPVEELSDRQYWWTHSWEYFTDNAAAVVSFDQADWTGWHELPQCYICIGWNFDDRQVELAEDESGEVWKYVAAKFRRENSVGCLVLCSMFYEDGIPVIPRGRTDEKSLVETPSLHDRLTGRLDYDIDPRESSGLRALQCQICLQFQGELTDDILRKAVNLHLISRDCFRQLWLSKAAAD